MKQNKKPKINTNSHFYHPFITIVSPLYRHSITSLSCFRQNFSVSTSVQFLTYNFSTVYPNFVFFIWLDSARKNEEHNADEMSKMDTKMSRIQWKQTLRFQTSNIILTLECNQMLIINRGYVFIFQSYLTLMHKLLFFFQRQNSPQTTNPKPLFINNYICMRA